MSCRILIIVSFRNSSCPGERAQWLGSHDELADNVGSIINTHMSAHMSVISNSSPRGPLMTYTGTRYAHGIHTYIRAHSGINEITIKLFKVTITL